MASSFLSALNVYDLSVDALIDDLCDSSGHDELRRVVTLNPQMVMACEDSAEMKKWLWSSDFLVADGIGIRLAGRRLGFKWPLIPGVELVAAIMRRPVSVYFLGAAPEVNADVRRVGSEPPYACSVLGGHDGFFGVEEWREIVADLTRLRPQFIFVAMGFPKQEEVIQALSSALDFGVAIGVGGSFDVLSGRVKRSPRLFRWLGLEWLWRGVCEPRRVEGWGGLSRFLWRYIVLGR